MYRLLALLLLGACATSQATAPDLSLADRFDLVAFRADDGSIYDTLWRWDRPILVHYIGPDEYRQDVYDHATLLGELTGKVVVVEGDYSNMTVEISGSDGPFDCQYDISTGDAARIHIWSEQPPAQIRSCIPQEMTQALGLTGDLDGVIGSRFDTVFASYQTADRLTDTDIALVHILYDPRLHHGMARAEAMPIVRQIVAEMEAEQEAANQ